MSKTVKIVLGVVAAVIVIGGASVWYFVLRDTAEQTASLSAIGGPGATTAAGPAKSTPDGAWKVQQGEGVFAGFRMQELFGGQTVKKTATGRSSAVTGTMTIKGDQVTAAEITVDMTKLKSDEARRDSAIGTRGIETQKFPNATFKLTSPITLPSTKQNEEVSITAKGDLTLHGQTKSVEIPLKATWTGNQIKVATVGDGVPIQLADYQIDPIDMAGFVKIDDHGTMELQLLFVPA